MSHRANPDLLYELQAYGAVNAEACFNCGTCTAVCSLTTDENQLPRKSIRLLQVGLKDSLLASVDPWMCYYCGDCSATCPREAEPAETMMALRRWLTAQYDRSGHSAKLYTSTRTAALTIIRLMLVTLGLFFIYHLATGFENIETDYVALNSFAPVMLVWALVLAHGAFLAYRMFSGVRTMARHVMGPVTAQVKIPLSMYLQEAKTLITHFFTQKRWRDCGEDRRRWKHHILLVSGYLTMLVLVMGLLWWFQTDEIYPLYHPQRWLGYYATIVLIYTSVEALAGRRRKQEQIHRFSHHTDWLFPAFILVGAVTGIIVHAFRYIGWPWPTYIMYVIHVMAMVAMLDTEVGVGKWAHLAYRPFAIYFQAVKEKALVRQEEPTGAFAAGD
jgi:ferredoxin